MSIFTVGLTGGIGAGKSTVAGIFQELGAAVLDADQIARNIAASDPSYISAVLERFGPEASCSDGTLNRRFLRERAFADRESLSFLENLIHDRIREQLLSGIRAATESYVIVCVPLMFEKGFDDIADRVLCIDLSEELQAERASARDGVSVDSVRRIMACQMSRSDRCRSSDDIMYNCGSFQEKRRCAVAFHRFYLELAQTKFQSLLCGNSPL